VPVPEVVPPALSTVKEIELSTLPVTVNVPLDVAAKALAAKTVNATTTVMSDIRRKVILLGGKSNPNSPLHPSDQKGKLPLGGKCLNYQ